VLLLFRFVLVVVAARFRRAVPPDGASTVRFTVLPHDCDLNFHLNGGRFLSFMDIARVELLARMRLLSKMLRRGWRPVMGGAMIRFRRSVLPFERFDVTSRLVGWDEKWFYLEHVVEKDGQHCAVAHARVLIRGRQGNVSTAEVAKLIGLDARFPVLPEVVSRWRDLEDAR
jgi:acyl-CoA thioesterase FadM